MQIEHAGYSGLGFRLAVTPMSMWLTLCSSFLILHDATTDDVAGDDLVVVTR